MNGRKFSRRALLKGIVLATAATGCSTVIDQHTQPGLPDGLAPPANTDRHPTAHLLNRATYGPRPGQIAAVEAIGHEAWLDRQLDYDRIDDAALNLRLRRYSSLNMTPRDLLGFTGDKRYLRYELTTATLLRAVYSERQLYEVMVGFWSDHFSIYHRKDRVAQLKTVDDRDVIRPHALGKFYDLLRASAHSPAMLIYLDNVMNGAETLNENYAREIMELHTLGVDGSYTEDDVKAVARCFTGWTVNGRGEFIFDADRHIPGPKVVLGHTVHSDNPKDDGERVLQILAAHPETARYVCTKLVRRLVADAPPVNIIEAAVSTWHATGGAIAPVVKTILMYPEFDTAPPKLKRPFELVTSLLRVTNARYDGDSGMIDQLEVMGHSPFDWPTPDGYPDTAAEWSSNMLARWNLCIDAFHGGLPGVSINVSSLLEAVNATQENKIDLLFRLFLKRMPRPDELQTLTPVADEDLPEALALLAASPAFQWR